MLQTIRKVLVPGLEPMVWPQQWKRHMRFSTCNVRGLYRSGSLTTTTTTTTTRELGRYKLDLVGVQEVSWDEGAW